MIQEQEEPTSRKVTIRNISKLFFDHLHNFYAFKFHSEKPNQLANVMKTIPLNSILFFSFDIVVVLCLLYLFCSIFELVRRKSFERL